jgi:hypothetical protein
VRAYRYTYGAYNDETKILVNASYSGPGGLRGRKLPVARRAS